MGFDWTKYQDGARFKFIHPGDKVEGEVVKISVTTFGGQAEPTPQLDIKTSSGNVLSVAASQTVLCSRLAEEAPEVGDIVSITYTGEADKAAPGRSPAKLFDVIVKRGETTAAPATQTPPVNEADEPF